MRLCLALCASAILTASADAQEPQQLQLPPSIGPSFSENAINASRFDAVFSMRVTLVPAVPLLIGQAPEARFDGVICNANSEGEGWVKANAEARFGVLKPGVCTMFGNFAHLQLTTPGSNAEWTAKIFLRAHK